MPASAFPGKEQLLSMLDGALRANSPEEITRQVADGLGEAIESRSFALPEPFRRPAADCYARRLVHSCPQHGYSVVAMVWGPGQGTAVHDHAGRWCVEGVFEGEIEVVQYELVETVSDRYRFQRQGTIRAGVGSTGSLIPPFEYHTIANPATRGSAVTLHVYASELTECSVFLPIGEDWYERHVRQLGYTA